MFTCNATTDVTDVFKSCRQGTTKLKKIGDYVYHYDYVIGSGTYSKVYEGLSLLTDKPVAIKVVDLEIIKQRNLSNLLFQQTELLSELNHPNVIKCYSLLKSENRCYIITELCKKENLEAIIDKAKNKLLAVSEAQRIIYDIFQGLQYLAQKSIIHRDLKTANILFSQAGKAKIADFGFATHGLSEFKDNFFVGTPLYMSPEAILEQKYGPKTDIWSFGVIVYELFFGRAPLSDCKTENQLFSSIVKPVNITPNHEISPDLADMIQGCLNTNSINRWGIDKLAKCQYIQSLKKKYYIHTDMFEPLKIKSIGSDMSKQSTSAQSHLYLYGQQHKVYQHSHSQQPTLNKIVPGMMNNMAMHSLKDINLHKNYTQPEVKQKIDHNNRETLNGKSYLSVQFQRTRNQQSKLQIGVHGNGKKNLKTDQGQKSQQLKIQPQAGRSHIQFTSPTRIVQRQSFGGFGLANQVYYAKVDNYTNNNSNSNNNSRKLVTQQNGRFNRQVSLNEQSSSNAASALTYKSLKSDNSRVVLKRIQSTQPASQQTQSTNNFNFNISINPNPSDYQRKSELPILNNQFKTGSPQSSIFWGKTLTYKQAVSLVHHCRLLHKVLQYPRYQSAYLRQWLIYLIKDLKQNAVITSLKQTHVTSLKTVLQGYYQQYTAEMPHLSQNKDTIPQIKSSCKVLQNLLDIDNQNRDHSPQKQLLIHILEDSRELEKCLLSHDNDLDRYAKLTKCEQYLEKFNNREQNHSIEKRKAIKIKLKQKKLRANKGKEQTK